MIIPITHKKNLDNLSEKLFNEFGTFFYIVDKNNDIFYSFNMTNFWAQIIKSNLNSIKNLFLEVITENKNYRKSYVARAEFGLYILGIPVIVNNFYEGSIIVGPFKKEDFNMIETAISTGISEVEIEELDDSVLFREGIIASLESILGYLSFYIAAIFELSSFNQSSDQYDFLNKITKILNGSLELSVLVKKVVYSIVENNIADNCSLIIFDLGKRYSVNKIPYSYKNIESMLVGEIKATNKIQFRHELHLDNDLNTALVCYKNMSAFPLLVSGNLIGALVLYHDEKIHPKIFEVISDNLALAMSKAEEFSKIKEESVTDVLTGFYMRRAFMTIFERELSSNKDSKKPTTIAMIDIDHFGHYNNTNGHPAGDKLLSELSHLFRSVVGVEHIIGRYGGEEFIILFQNLNFADSRDLCTKLLESIRSHSFAHQEKQPNGNITISMGMFSCLDSTCTMQEIIRIADQMLYKSKDNGRDKLSIAFKTSAPLTVIEV